MDQIDKILAEVDRQADAKGRLTFTAAVEYFLAKDVTQARSSEARAMSRRDIDSG